MSDDSVRIKAGKFEIAIKHKVLAAVSNLYSELDANTFDRPTDDLVLPIDCDSMVVLEMVVELLGIVDGPPDDIFDRIKEWSSVRIGNTTHMERVQTIKILDLIDLKYSYVLIDLVRFLHERIVITYEGFTRTVFLRNLMDPKAVIKLQPTVNRDCFDIVIYIGVGMFDNNRKRVRMDTSDPDIPRPSTLVVKPREYMSEFKAHMLDMVVSIAEAYLDYGGNIAFKSLSHLSAVVGWNTHMFLNPDVNHADFDRQCQRLYDAFKRYPDLQRDLFLHIMNRIHKYPYSPDTLRISHPATRVNINMSMIDGELKISLTRSPDQTRV
jgi:hypothetical protein